MAKKLVMFMGFVLVLVGILGFINNPLVGEEALFHTNRVHDIAHLLIGVIMFALASSAPVAALNLFGAVFLFLAVLGFVTESPLLGILEINTADNWLHAALSAILLGFGVLLKKSVPEAMSVPPVPQQTNPQI